MYAFIINHELVTWPQQQVLWLKSSGLTPVIVDTGSKSDKVHRWYSQEPCRVILCDNQYGFTTPWQTDVSGSSPIDIFVRAGDHYLVTDPDLDLSTLPADWVDRMLSALASFPEASKIGAELATGDLPDTEIANLALGQALAAPREVLDALHHRVLTDTTLALYRKDSGHPTRLPVSSLALRRQDCQVRHLPWYNDLPEDFVEMVLLHRSHMQWPNEIRKRLCAS